MKKTVLKGVMILWGVLSLTAMPPHPDVVQKYKNSGEMTLMPNRTAADRAIGRNGANRVFPSAGPRKILVLLAEFSDAPLDSSSTPQFYDTLFTGAAADSLSWKKYFLDMSGGKLDLEFDVYDAGTFGSHNYYGSNLPTVDDNAREFVSDVVTEFTAARDATIDFSQYDNDGDGYIDTVIVIHQGQGEEYSGNESDIWSHQWNIPTPVDTGDEVQFSGYTLQPEFLEVPGDSTIGVFVHEFGHVLGLPDLYDTGPYDPQDADLPVSDGIGEWGVMAAGAWSGPDGLGSRPAPLSAWCRLQMGWITADVLHETAKVIIAPLPWNRILTNLLIMSLLSSLVLFILRKRRVLRSPKPALIPLLLVTAILFSTCGDKLTVTLETVVDIETSRQAKIVEITADEYILIENKVRKDETWTEYLPGSGLLMYHIDDALISARYGANDINNYSLSNMLGVRIIEADEGNELLDRFDSDSGSLSDTFSKRNRHSLTGYKSNSGTEAGFEITNIAAEGSSMSFNLLFTSEQ